MSAITMSEGNTLNNLDRNNHPNRSKFEFTDGLAFNPLFGQISPFFCRRVEDTDRFSNRAEFDLRTLSLKSPLMQDLKLYKNYFSVPMECILPNNWKTKIYPNPTLGDDVPADAYTSSTLTFSWLEPFASFAPSDSLGKSNCFNVLVTLQNIFGSSSLANVLGYGIPRYDIGNDVLLSLAGLVTKVYIYPYDATQRSDYIYSYTFPTAMPAIDKLHRLLSLVSDYPCLFDFKSDAFPTQQFQEVIQDYLQFISIYNNSFTFDLARLWAYQLVCAHFYSNDKIDFVYSADLFRQSIFSLFSSVSGDPSTVFSFDYNGQYIQYDYLSSKYFSSIISSTFDLASFRCLFVLRYLNAIFSYRRSLKYEDYFTGARPRPLAIGGDKMPVQISVNANSVSVVDVTRSIQAQKFLNQVNRVGRKFSNYLAGLFGKAPQEDWHDPKFLASMKETIYGQETRNTGAAQFDQVNNITSNLRCDSNNIEVTAEFDRQCIMLGLVSFDIVRYYDNATVRDTLIKDRYDMFNPYMQYIGDQALYTKELDRRIADSAVLNTPFGYSTRYLDLKTSFPRACGAFATNKLPSWLFKASDIYLLGNGEQFTHINPDYIRSYPAELDDYFLNGVGIAGADYFHFILLVRNNITALRPMAVNPQILG